MVFSKTFDRLKEVAVKKQSVGESLNENLQQLRRQQLNCSNEISLELDKIVCSQAEFSQNTKEKISEINSLCDNFSTTSSSLEEIFSNFLRELNNEHRNAHALEEIRNKEQSFRQVINEKLCSLDLYYEQQKSALGSMRLRIKERFTSHNCELHKHTEKINAAINEITQRSLENLQELKKITNMLSEERCLMEEEEKLIEKIHRNHIKINELHPQLRNKVNNIDNCQKTIVNAAANTTKLISLVEHAISKIELSIDEIAAKCSTISTEVGNLVQETFTHTEYIDVAKMESN